jgi:hypothetical protein
MVPLTNNRLGWSIGGRSNASDGSSFWSESQDEATDSYACANDSARNADWSEAETESIDEICSQMRSKRNPFGFGTYGDLIDKTPRHMISRVMFEEKGFRTWYGGRTVLIGDGKNNGYFVVIVANREFAVPVKMWTANNFIVNFFLFLV